MITYDFSVPMTLGALLGRILATSVSEPPALSDATMSILRTLGAKAQKERKDLDDPADVGPGAN